MAQPRKTIAPPSKKAAPLKVSARKVPTLKADPERFPNVHANPSLERALRIRQELEKGRPREEAVALADAALGPRGKALLAKSGKPARPARKPAAMHAPTKRRR